MDKYKLYDSQHGKAEKVQFLIGLVQAHVSAYIIQTFCIST